MMRRMLSALATPRQNRHSISPHRSSRLILERSVCRCCARSAKIRLQRLRRKIDQIISAFWFPTLARVYTGNPYERASVVRPGAGPVKLELADDPSQKPAAAKPVTGNPYERAAVARPGTKDAAGSDPYSRGPARKPESMTFNPHERPKTRKP